MSAVDQQRAQPDAPARDDQATRLRALMEQLARAREAAPDPDRPRWVDRAASPEPLRPAAIRTARPPRRVATPPGAPHTRAARVIAMASGKGGVGKTNLAVSLAVSLSRADVRTALVDADFGLANADVLCGLRPGSHVGQALDGSCTVDDVIVEVPGGFLLLPGAGGVGRLAELADREALRLLSRLEAIERRADAVIIDCAAGIGRGVLHLLLAADMPVVVSTPEPTSIADAYGVIKAASRLAGEERRPFVPQLLVNMAADEAAARRVHARISSVCDRFLSLPLGMLGWTPQDDAVGKAVRRRTPFALASPRAPASRAVRAIAAEAVDRLELRRPEDERRSSWVARLLRPRIAREK